MSTSIISNPSVNFGLRFTLVNGTFPAQASISVSQPTTQPSVVVGSGASGVTGGTIVNLSVASGTPYTLNLLTGPDALGGTMGATELVGWMVINTAGAGAGNLVVGGGTHPVMGSDQVTLVPGDYIQKVSTITGNTVTGSSSDTLTITSSSGTVTGQLVLFFR